MRSSAGRLVLQIAGGLCVLAGALGGTVLMIAGLALLQYGVRTESDA